MIKFFKNIFKKSDDSEFYQFVRNEYKSEWKYYRQHLYNPLVKERKQMSDFINSL